MLNFINSDLKIDLTEVAIDRTHRMRDPEKKRRRFGL